MNGFGGIPMQIAGLDVSTVTIRFESSGREVKVISETTLMDAVHQASLPLGQSCDGVAMCGFCKVRVVSGAEYLTPAGAEEKKILASLHAAAGERLACCARPSGDVTVTTDYW